MNRALNTKRYAEVETLEELTRLLDEQDFRERLSITQRYGNALFPRAVCGSLLNPSDRNAGLRTGILAQLTGPKVIRRADAATKVEANGIVVATVGVNQFIWAPQAILTIPVAGEFTQINQPIFLGQDGVPTFTQPESGYSQRCGKGLAFDKNSGNYLCLVQCDVAIVF